MYYRVLEVLISDSVYVLESLFTENKVQREAGQVKPYNGREDWLTEPLVCLIATQTMNNGLHV